MWTRSGVAGSEASSSKSDRKRSNGSSRSKKSSKSDSSKSSSRSVNADPDSSRRGDGRRRYGSSDDDTQSTRRPDSSRRKQSDPVPSSMAPTPSANPYTSTDSRRGQEERGPGPDEQPNPAELSHDASLLPNQFPGQTPWDYSIPSIRPDISSGGYGLAADYYNDQGESVHRQPGVRPHTPIVTGAEPHLMAALAEPNPPQETGQGSAADFYGSANTAQSEASYHTTQSHSQGSYSSAMAVGATGVAAAGAAALAGGSESLANGSGSLANGSGSLADGPGAFAGGSGSPPSTSQRPSGKPSKFSSSNVPLIAAGAAVAGVAGLGAAAYAHHTHQHDSQYGPQPTNSSADPRRSRVQTERPPPVAYAAGKSASYQQQHEHRGPISKFFDWWNNHEDVRKMEEYTEYIGVCRYCFDPQSDPRDAPRKHRPHKRSSREFRDRGRVDKESRYAKAPSSASSDSEGGNKGIWAAAGLAGLGLASARKAKQRKDFDDYSTKIGRRDSQTALDSKQSRVSYDRRSSATPGRVSRDQDTRDALLGGAVGAATGVGIAEAVVQSGSRSTRRKSSDLETVRRRPSRTSRVGGGPSDSESSVGFFGKMFSPRSKNPNKTRRKSSSGVYQNDSATSSLVNGLAYGREDSRSTRGKTKREPSARDASNAILGLGTAAALLATAESRRNRNSRRQPDLVAVRESRNMPSKPPLTRDSLKQLQQQSDDGWEDASDSAKSSSVDTGLAFGDFHLGRSASARRSSSSINSQKTRRHRRASSFTDTQQRPGAFLPTIVGSPPVLAENDSRDSGRLADPAVESETQAPLQYIEPRPMSDFNNADLAGDFPAVPLHADVRDVPLQQPQPKSAIRNRHYPDGDQFDRFAPPPSTGSTYPSEQFRPGISRVETLPDNYGDANFPDGYSFPKRRQTEPISSGGSRESPNGSHRAYSPRRQSRPEDHNFVRDAAIGGAVVGAVGVASALSDGGKRRSSRQSAQSVRFATEERSTDDQTERNERNGREAVILENSTQRETLNDDRLPHEFQTVEPRFNIPESVLSGADKGQDIREPNYELDDRDKRMSDLQSSFVPPLPVEVIPRIPGAFESEAAEDSRLARVVSEPQVEIRHQGQNREDHEPILDDEIFDPNFFKRSRAASEPEVQGRQRTASFVVADLENRYSSKPPSMAEFFAPPELSNRSSAVGTQVDTGVESMLAEDVVDFHSDTRDLTRSMYEPMSMAQAMASIPRLNVIAPTPPSSYAGSAKDPHSRSTSPAASGSGVEEIVTESTAKAVTSSRSVTWADQRLPDADSTGIDDVEPASSNRDAEDDIENTSSKKGAANVPDLQEADPYDVAEVRPKTYMPGSFSDDEDDILTRSISPPRTIRTAWDPAGQVREPERFRDNDVVLSNSRDQTSASYEVIDNARNTSNATNESWNGFPPAGSIGRESRSGKKPSGAPLEDEEGEDDSGRRSRVPEEKVNTSFPFWSTANPDRTSVDKFQESPSGGGPSSVSEGHMALEDNSSSRGGTKLPTDRSTDSLLDLERGLERDNLRDERQRSSMEAYTSLESYRDVPEMIHLPDSRPGSPYGDESESTALLQEPGRTPTSPVLARAPSATAVPLPFFRRTPQSPWSNRESPVASPSANDQSPTSATRTRTSRPSSIDFKSNEIRPLYLLERNRKASQLEPEEDLPSLPSSHTTSRASSVLGGDEVFESAQQSLEHSPVLSEASFNHESSLEREVPETEYLDSQQATPKATAVSENLPQVPNQPLDDRIVSETRDDATGVYHPELATATMAVDGTGAIFGHENNRTSSEGDEEILDGPTSAIEPTLEPLTTAGSDTRTTAVPDEPFSAQEANVEDEEEQWTISQPLRGKKGKKAKKGKKSRPAPIQTLSNASGSQNSATVSSSSPRDVADADVSSAYITQREPSLNRDRRGMEPPLTARRDSLTEHQLSDGQISPMGTQQASNDVLVNASSDGLEGERRVESDPPYDTAVEQLGDEPTENVVTEGFDRQKPSHPEAITLPMVLDNEPAKEPVENDAEGILGASPLRQFPADIRSEYDDPQLIDSPLGTEPQSAESSSLPHNRQPISPDEVHAVDTEDETPLHPTDVAMLDNIINRRQSEEYDHGNALEGSGSVSPGGARNIDTVDVDPNTVMDTFSRDLQEPRDAQHSIQTGVDKDGEGSNDAEINIEAQREGKADDIENFSWVSKSNKKGKKGKKGKQRSEMYESESSPRTATEPAGSGPQTPSSTSAPVSDDEWSQPSKSKKKKGKNRKSSLPLAAILGASAVAAASDIREKPSSRAQDMPDYETGEGDSPSDSQANEVSQPVIVDEISSTEPMTADAEDEWALPKSKSKKANKKLRFSAQPAAEISAEDPGVHGIRGEEAYEPHSIQDESPIPEPQSADAETLAPVGGLTNTDSTNESMRLAANPVPGAFPDEVLDTTEPSIIPSRQRDYDAEEMGEFPYEAEADPEIEKVTTADFLEELREEESQSPVPHAITASYSGPEVSEETSESIRQGQEAERDLAELLPPEETAEASTVAIDQDALNSVAEREDIDEWDMAPKSKKKSKKGKSRQVIESKQSESAELTTEESSTKPSTSEEPKSGKEKKKKKEKEKKSKKFSLFSAFQSKDEPTKSKSSRRRTSDERDTDERGLRDKDSGDSPKAEVEMITEPPSMDTEDFMEQGDLLEEGTGNTYAMGRQPHTVQDYQRQISDDSSHSVPEIEAERVLAVGRALEEDRPIPGQYAASDVDEFQNEPRPQPQAADVMGEEELGQVRAFDEIGSFADEDATRAPQRGIPGQQLGNEPSREQVDIEADAFLDEERAMEEHYPSEKDVISTSTLDHSARQIPLAVNNDSAETMITDVDQHFHELDSSVRDFDRGPRPLSPIQTLGSETVVAEESEPLPSSTISKKEKKKAKKAKKNQRLPVDQLRSTDDTEEDMSRASTSLANTLKSLDDDEVIMAAESSTALEPIDLAETEPEIPNERQIRPVTTAEIAAMPTFEPVTRLPVSELDPSPAVRRSLSITKLWPSHTTSSAKVMPRSSSESRTDLPEDAEFTAALAAGLEAGGFHPDMALHGAQGRKSLIWTNSKSMVEEDAGHITDTGSSTRQRAQETSWSFSPLDEVSSDRRDVKAREPAMTMDRDDDSTFNDIVALGLSSAGFDPRTATKSGPSDRTSASSRAVRTQPEVVENEVAAITMRTPSPKGPAEQWLNSSRRGSPVSIETGPSNSRDMENELAQHHPTNRDSAMNIPESPRMSASSSNPKVVRDSGYHDTMPTTPASRTSEYHRDSGNLDTTPPASPGPRAASPIVSTSKERTSSLFQSPPHVMTEQENPTGERDASIYQTPVSQAINYADRTGPSEHSSLQATVEDEYEPSQDPYANSPSGTRYFSTTSHHGSRSRELGTIAEGSPEISPVRIQERQSRSRSGVSTAEREEIAGYPGLQQDPASGHHNRGASVNSDEMSSQLRKATVSPTASEIANSRRPYARSSNNASPIGDLGRPGSALSARSRTPGSAVSNRSGNQALRRSNPSSDLGAEFKRGEAQARGYPANASTADSLPENIETEQPSIYAPLKGSGRVSSRDLSDTAVYDESSRSPPLPQSGRNRQSLDQTMAESRSLQDSRGLASTEAPEFPDDGSFVARDDVLRQKDVEIETIRTSLETLQQEVSRLTKHNEQLTEANRNLSNDTNERYATIQAEHDSVHQQWQQTSRELEKERDDHGALRTGMEAAIGKEIESALAEKNAEIQSLRDELSAATEQIRSLQSQIQQSSSSSRGISGEAAISSSDDFLNVRNDDYIDSACHQLCAHVQQWILRFSKFSDMRACRLSRDIHDESIESRLDNAVLDDTDVDVYLSDRIKRRDVFMSLTMTMIWEYVFTRYLFGMDRAQRQMLKNLEKTLSEVGPQSAVAQWRATTLTLLSRRDSFAKQRDSDTEAVLQQIFSTLSTLLPPPHNLVSQIQSSLRNVIRLAVDLSIEMRTQRPEYVMLPPIHPEYDTNGDLVRKVYFNASLMNERSGDFGDNGALEVQERSVRIVLFPLVVRKGDEFGEGSEEVVVAPAQVLVSRTKEEESRARGTGANSSARSVRGLGAEYGNRSQVSIAPPGTGSGFGGNTV